MRHKLSIETLEAQHLRVPAHGAPNVADRERDMVDAVQAERRRCFSVGHRPGGQQRWGICSGYGGEGVVWYKSSFP